MEAFRVMKKLIVVFILFLVSCESTPIISSTNNLALTPSTDEGDTRIIPSLTNAGNGSTIPDSRLTVEGRDQYILNFVKNNEECKLPCFLGITPGETKEEEINNLLNHLSLNADKISHGTIEAYDFSWKKNGSDEFLSMQIYVDNGVVTVMAVNISGLDDETYKKYSPEYFLKNFGGPDRILVTIRPPDPSSEPPSLPITDLPTSPSCCAKDQDANYSIRFVFSKIWLSIGIRGFADKVEGKYWFCPKNDMDQKMTSNHAIEMILQSSEHQIPADEFWEKYQIEINGQIVEKAVGKDINSFMKDYQKGECFPSPENFWHP
jgi:hypothetical protein